MKAAKHRSPALRLASLTGLLLILTMFNSCTRGDGPNSYVRDEVNSVRDRTVPWGAVIGGSSGPNVSANSAIARWAFETTEEKGVYVAWVKTQFERGFSLKPSDESSLIFVKQFNGDAVSVNIQIAPSNGILHVQVTLEMYPD